MVVDAGASTMAGFMREARTYPEGAVATPHYLATNAGLATLAAGGNALDAALAANLVLGVVVPYLCGYGGDVLAIVWDGSLHGYIGAGTRAECGDGRGRARAQRRTPEPDGRHADVRSPRGHGSGRAPGLVRPARAVGEPVVRRPRTSRRCGTPSTDFR